MTVQRGCLTAASIVSLAVLSTGAEAASCSGAPINGSPITINGAAACEINMRAYASACGSVTNPTGPYPICEESFKEAVSAANSYLSSNGSSALVINIDPGTYDYSYETANLANENGAIDVSGIAPPDAPGTGCLINQPLSDGQAPSGNGCLIIQGHSSSDTTLVTAPAINEIGSIGASHILVRFLTFEKANVAETQGTFVSSGTTVVSNGSLSDTFATLTLDIEPGYPTPENLYLLACEAYGGFTLAQCSASPPPLAPDKLKIEAFTGGNPNQPVLSTCGTASLGCENGQAYWGYPQTAGNHSTQIAAAPPIQVGANRWTLTFSMPTSEQAVPEAYSGTTNGSNNLICMRADYAPTFFFKGGTDVIFNRVVWVGGTRGTFRGVNGSTSGFPAGAQVYYSELLPNSYNGTLACVSQAGGLQIGNRSDPPIFGNVVYGLKATNTGDDSIAVFNDIGTLAAQSVIDHSTITGSFARFIYLTENVNDIYREDPGCPGVGTSTMMTNTLPCSSPVSVDSYTKDNISQCDPYVFGTSVVLGGDNCPIKYEP